MKGVRDAAAPRKVVQIQLPKFNKSIMDSAQCWKLQKTEIIFVEKFEKKVKFANYFNDFFLVVPLNNCKLQIYIELW